MEVTSDYDPAADFTNLKTYDWLPHEAMEESGDIRIQDNPVLERRIHNAVDQELVEKGFSRVTDGNPDFLVSYYATLDEKTDVSIVNDYYGYAPGWGWYYDYRYPYPSRARGPEARVYQYEEGTLILDIVDAESKKLLWRGLARDEVNFSEAPETKEKRIREAVEHMMKDFPPHKM